MDNGLNVVQFVKKYGDNWQYYHILSKCDTAYSAAYHTNNRHEGNNKSEFKDALAMRANIDQARKAVEANSYNIMGII